MPRVACVGGFLGSGKTTAILQAARTLLRLGVRVGIITNDQGKSLVDTALVRSFGFQAEEIGGGCFCCRFSELAENARRLAQQTQAQVILAEAVGSCTDLSARVCKRLRQYYSAEFSVAPLTVMVDPNRVREMLAAASPFNEDVQYLFGRQLAEADRIVLTKAELFSGQELQRLQTQLMHLAEGVPISVISAKTGAGVAEWVDLLIEESGRQTPFEVDYERYGAAETSMGWLNANFDLVADRAFSSREVAEALVSTIQHTCRLGKHAVAHLKVLTVTADGSNCIALTGTQGSAAWGENRQLQPSYEVSLILNARVCVEPEQLRRIVLDAFQGVASNRGMRGALRYVEAFSPLPPKRPQASHFARDHMQSVVRGNFHAEKQ